MRTEESLIEVIEGRPCWAAVTGTSALYRPEGADWIGVIQDYEGRWHAAVIDSERGGVRQSILTPVPREAVQWIETR